MQNILATASPPPYSRVVLSTDTWRQESETDFDDNDGGDEGSTNPVSVLIDTSIKIAGHGNTVVVPSGTTRHDSRPGAVDDASASASASAPVSLSPAAFLQSAQEHRQTRLSGLATAIICALKCAETSSDGGAGSRRAIEIGINAGIQIEGNRNVICAGVAPRSPGRKDAQDTGANGSLAGRKRRAQSVCLPFTSSSSSSSSCGVY